MRRVYNFIGARWVFITLSIVLITAGLGFFIAFGGFNYSIDFTPGLNEQFKVDPAASEATIAEVRRVLGPVGRFDLQEVGSPAEQQFVVKVLARDAGPDFQSRTESQIMQLLEGAFGAGSVTVQSSDFVGPRYSSELATQTVWILLVAVILILIYAAFRFKFVYGMAAVLCLVHDALFMLAVNAVFRLEFSTTTVAAVLTIIGYSINDTIVIFDRARENRGLMPNADLKTILNTSISQTLGRTVLTSFTVFLSIIALVVLGKGDIKNFAILMLVGIFEGAYSTIFIASPIVYMWTMGNEKRRRAHDLSKYGRGLAPAAASAVAAAPHAAPALTPTGEIGSEEGDLGVEVSDEEPIAAEEYTEASAAQAPAKPGSAQARPGPAPGAPAAQPSPVSVPQQDGGPGGSYVRLQRRHKKRKR